METVATSHPKRADARTLRSSLIPTALGRRIRPETFAFTLILGLLGALPPLSIDISAPTLVVVQTQFGVSASVVGMVITLFMVGFAVGQFAAGPLSDRQGRRPVLLMGLSLYTTAAIGCCLANSTWVLIGWRFLQGIGAGTCAVLTFAMIRDLFDGDQARAKRSYITVIFGIAPMLAPLLGAWILSTAGWRLVYLVLAVGGTVLLLTVTFGVAESRIPSTEAALNWWASCRSVVKDRRFMGVVAVNGLSFGSVFAYIAGSPLVLMGSLAMTPTGYGQVFACTAAMLTLGAWVSGRCAQGGVSCRTLLWIGLGGGALSALALALVTQFGGAGILGLLPPLMVNLFARGLTAPNVQHLALEPMREQAGTAASVVGVIQILSGAVSSAVIALLFPLLGALSMGLVMAILSIGAVVLWSLLRSSTRSATA